jgi:hypothetical protein
MIGIFAASTIVDTKAAKLGIAWRAARPRRGCDLAGRGAVALPQHREQEVLPIAQAIAAVAARVLTKDGHVGSAYLLTGAEVFTDRLVGRKPRTFAAWCARNASAFTKPTA